MKFSELIEIYQVVKGWSCIKRQDDLFNFFRAYLGECADGKWLVVFTDSNCREAELMVVNTRSTAINKMRHRGFLTRLNKIYHRK
jgi:hypothetical protein